MTKPTASSPIILSPPLEKKLIAICHREDLVDLTERWCSWWNYHKQDYDTQQISVADRSHLLASIFLHPTIKLESFYEAPISLKSDLIKLTRDTAFDFQAKCDDVPLLLSYCTAAEPDLDATKICKLLLDVHAANEAVIQAWGEMPISDGEGHPLLFGDDLVGLLGDDVAVTEQRSLPQYSQHQLDTYKQFVAAKEAAAVVLSCYKNLNSIWSRKAGGDAIAVHPKLQRTYQRVLSADDFDDGLTETDIFFLSVRALRTLPVGRTLKETLELAASSAGIALRQRVAELNAELQTGGQAAIPHILDRIERDADNYRSLTSRLKSPHTLSSAADVALGVAGLVPVIGMLFGGVGVLKSSYATFSALNANQTLKKMLWATYQGRSI